MTFPIAAETNQAPQSMIAGDMPIHIYQALIEQSSEGVAIAGLDAQIAYANPAFRAMTGLGNKAVGTSFFVLYPPETQAHIQATLMPTLLSNGHWQGPLPALKPDGTPWITHISVFIITNPLDGSSQLAAILRDVTEQQAHEQRLRQFEALVEHAAVGMALTDLEGNYTYTNTALRELTGYGDALHTMSIPQLLTPEEQGSVDTKMATLFSTGRLSIETMFLCRDKKACPVHVSALMIHDAKGTAISTGAIIRDLTEEQRTERERHALQEQIIAVQQATLQELSTPLIPISDGVVAMPLIGTIDSNRAQQVIEALLNGVATSQAKTVILDITGVPVVDTQVASALLRAAQMVRLLGAEVTLTGIRPEVAQTLVGLGIDLSAITTRSTLQSGIREALKKS